MTRPLLDLSTCDKEPIRFPGSIQPHGFLIALSQEMDIVQVSDNLVVHTGIEPGNALGQPLSYLLDERFAEEIIAVLNKGTPGSHPRYISTVTLYDNRRFDVLAHAYDQLLVLEFEHAGRSISEEFRHLYPLVGDFLQKLNDVASVKIMSELAAAQIREVTGFARVLVYRFDHDGHGQVVAESGDDSLPSYMGQCFPASDIPRQARELYALNHIRLICDANYEPAALLPNNNPLTGNANDLSFAALRSVSPVHLQYMRNMGTLSSMSISLMVKGKLWGLVSCHHPLPRHVPFDRRTVCEHLGQILALRIESKEDADELQFRLDVRRIMVSTLSRLTKGADFFDNMRQVFPELLQFARASGIAIVIDDRVATCGDVPDEEAIRSLVGWLDLHTHEDLFYTDKLSSHYDQAASMVDIASGLLAISISRIHKHYLLWFRPEQIYTIAWAGNPHVKDAVSDSVQQLSPRISFDIWRETVHATSRPWHAGEIELAAEFRTALLAIALERAEQMADLAEELGRANKELEAFSYSVSHDLRAPLRHIAGFSDVLLETAGSENLERRQRFLKNIKESAQLAGKLVDDLLSFSQMGRASLRPVDTDMTQLINACIDRMAIDIKDRKITWEIAPLPTVCIDPAFFQLALYNLLSNAVKFTAQQETAIIRINAEQSDTDTVFHIVDNGVGFNMKYVHKLFGVFQRLHRMEDFKGTGIGLANVRRIVERHGGKVWANSAPGEGATFSFSVPTISSLT